mgnify:CR=1 FL=1
MKVKETQPVHVLTNFPSTSANVLNILGNVDHKLNPKLELEASKAEAIRQRSQEAEKERLARKTVELDVLPVVAGRRGQQQQKRLITRRPSVTNSSGLTSTTNTNTSTNTNTNASNSFNSYPLKTRIIQILAIGPIQIDQLIQKLSTTAVVLRPFLNELCLDPSKSNGLQLRPELFAEVKLSDWPFYSLREREQVSKNVASARTSHATPPETPETPSPKKQIYSANFVTRTSAPPSAKKTTTAKDRLSAIMKRRRS